MNEREKCHPFSRISFELKEKKKEEEEEERNIKEINWLFIFISWNFNN